MSENIISLLEFALANVFGVGIHIESPSAFIYLGTKKIHLSKGLVYKLNLKYTDYRINQSF